jgi:hypothetical protein
MLKKSFSLFFVFLCFALAACSKGEPNSPVNKINVSKNFKCDISLRYNEMDIEGHLFKNGSGNIEFEINSPGSMSGLVLKIENEKVFIKYGGVNFEVSAQAYPEVAFAPVILSAFDTVSSSSEIAVKSVEDTFEISGATAQGSFKLVQNKQSGFYISLETTNPSIVVKFTDFKNID